MISKVRVKFDEPQMDEVQKFARTVGLSIEDFCRQAVFYAINHAYQRAAEVQAVAAEEGTNGPHDTTSTDTQGTLAPSLHEDTSGSTLPDTETSTAQG